MEQNPCPHEAQLCLLSKQVSLVHNAGSQGQSLEEVMPQLSPEDK